jgi:hypothetical protein
MVHTDSATALYVIFDWGALELDLKSCLPNLYILFKLR